MTLPHLALGEGVDALVARRIAAESEARNGRIVCQLRQVQAARAGRAQQRPVSALRNDLIC